MKQNHSSPVHAIATRRDILRHGLRGCTVASIGFGFTLAGGTLSIAQAAESEQAKKAKAKHTLTMGLDAKLNQFPGRAGTPDMVWVFGAPQFKEAIEKGSGGRIYVEVHDGGALGGQTVLLKKVQQGVVHAGSCTTQNAAQLVPLLNILDVPYGIGADDDSFWRLLFSKEFNDVFRKATEARRVTLAFSHPWRRRVMLSRNVSKEIHKPDDLKGMKIRVTASKFEQLAFQVLPTNGVPIAWSETFSALKDGVMEGVHIAPGSGFDVGMAPVIGQIVDTEWMYNTDSIWLSTTWLNGLGAELKEVVMAAALEAQKFVVAGYKPILRDTMGLAPDSPASAGFKGAGTRVAFLTADEKAVWRDFLSVERQPAFKDAIKSFGEDAYKTLRQVVAGKGSTAPRAWWKA